MKNLKRMMALLLALCLCISAFPVASAAGITEDCQDPLCTEDHLHTGDEADTVDVYETYDPSVAETAENGKIPQKGGYISWSLEKDGTLLISGNGRIVSFSSAEDQPWAAVREEITAVRFDHSSHMDISSVAYWFSGCVNLESCEISAFADLGTDSFRDCAKLETLMLYHNSEVPQIADTAFQCGNGTTLSIVVVEDMVCAALTAASFYGRDVEVMVRPPIQSFGVCGLPGCTCTSCTWTYDYEYKDEDSHYKWEVCTKCSANEYHTRIAVPHTFNSRGVCTQCGYEESCSHYNTRTRWYGCDWEEYCVDCGEILDWGTTHGTYSYSAWEYYTTSQHRRYGTCNDCGEGKYQYGSHSTTTKYEKYSDTQHSVNNYCSTCTSNVGAATYGNHNFTYSTWTSVSDTQHQRTKTCSLCAYSGNETGAHADSNKDGKCDTCGYSMSVTVTWDAGTNGGTVNGGKSVTTASPIGSTAAAPSYTPVKTGHSFKGWYTSASGGALYSTVTISSAQTFYAQFTANSYTITWDLGDGKTETTRQEYGKPLVFPAQEPSRDNAYFDGWYTQESGGTQVDETTVFTGTKDTTYYAHWIEVFSVTVPTVLPLRVDENGQVYGSIASIQNHSSGKVQVSSITLEAQNGWTIVPYDHNMAQEKVDAKCVGLSLNMVPTVTTGDRETLVLKSGWIIPMDEEAPLTYDAVVSALSQPVTDEEILSVLFVVQWVNEIGV